MTQFFSARMLMLFCIVILGGISSILHAQEGIPVISSIPTTADLGGSLVLRGSFAPMNTVAIGTIGSDDWGNIYTDKYMGIISNVPSADGTTIEISMSGRLALMDSYGDPTSITQPIGLGQYEICLLDAGGRQVDGKIVTVVNPSITIVYPDTEGIVFEPFQKHPVKWTPVSSGTVTISIVSANGTATELASGLDGSSGSATVTIPELAEGKYRIAVASSLGVGSIGEAFDIQVDSTPDGEDLLVIQLPFSGMATAKRAGKKIVTAAEITQAPSWYPLNSVKASLSGKSFSITGSN